MLSTRLLTLCVHVVTRSVVKVVPAHHLPPNSCPVTQAVDQPAGACAVTSSE
jgi:hypothetical protein